MVIAVDFDHTLVNFDKPVEGAKEAMQELRDAGHHVMIYSCNNYDWILKVLNNNDIPYDSIYDNSAGGGKPIACVYIDDRAVGFRGDWNVALAETKAIIASRRSPTGLF